MITKMWFDRDSNGTPMLVTEVKYKNMTPSFVRMYTEVSEEVFDQWVPNTVFDCVHYLDPQGVCRLCGTKFVMLGDSDGAS